MKLIKIWACMVMLFMLAVVWPGIHKLYAQQYSNSIAPQSYWIVAKPGSEFYLPYVISNTGDPVVLNIKTYWVQIIDSEGNISLTPISESAQNISFSLNNSSQPLESAFLIKTGESVEFEIKANVKAEIEQGDYYFVFAAESTDAEVFEKGSSVNILAGIGSILYLSVSEKGSLEENAKIASFDVSSIGKVKIGDKIIKIVDSSKTANLILQVANLGSNLVSVSGKIRIDTFGKNSQSIEIVKQNIPSQSQKNIIYQETKLFPDILGFSEIRADLIYGQSSKALTETVYLLLFPVQIGLISGIIVVLFIFWKLKIK